MQATAGYQIHTTETTRTESGALLRQFVVTAHGVVARTDAGGVWEVALLRPRCTYGRFQGSVYPTGTPGVWRLRGPKGEELGTVTGDYIDAEAVLIARRSEVRSQAVAVWPAHMRHAISPTAQREARRIAREATLPRCGDCGHLLPQGGECERPDLHWTLDSLGAGKRELVGV